MEKFITEELKKYASILETHFHDMVEMGFTVENNVFYVLSANIGKRTAIANLKIVISMFLEGKMDVNDVVLKLPYQEIEDLLNEYNLINSDELTLLAKGLPASKGIGIGTVCFSQEEISRSIEKQENFIYCKNEYDPNDIGVILPSFCQGVISIRGGMTSHAAVVCRGMKQTCVTGIGVDFKKFQDILLLHNNKATIDGNKGIIYGGIGEVQKNNHSLPEIKILYELLKIIIKCNIVTIKTAPYVWRLWDIIVLDRRYARKENIEKRMTDKTNVQYRSFKQPSQNSINRISQSLCYLENGELIIRGFIEFMVSMLSAQVPLGNHFLYMRPLLNPIKSMRFIKNKHQEYRNNLAGYQLTGIEFFNINQFIDYLIDIASIKIYFETEFYYFDDRIKKEQKQYFPLNFLDYTNPKGESLIINTYNTLKAIIYVNGVIVPSEKLALFYHLVRRRKYHWSWYEENIVTKNEILQYLTSKSYFSREHTRMHYLCEEMNLINGTDLTPVGLSLLGRKYFE
jgi:phosphohistidine swiveling domain-containing protein